MPFGFHSPLGIKCGWCKSCLRLRWRRMFGQNLVINGLTPWCRRPLFKGGGRNAHIYIFIYLFIYIFIYLYLYRRKFRSQTSDNMDRWKAEQGRGREKRKIRRKKSRRERVRRKKMQMREKVGKSRNTVFFQWFGAPEGRKVQRRDEKLHAVVARSTFPSQNVQNTPLSDHFWKLRCRKSARRCGAKHISKSKC